DGFLSRKGREGDFRFERRGMIFPFGHDDSPCVRLSYHTCPNFGEHLCFHLRTEFDLDLFGTFAHPKRLLDHLWNILAPVRKRLAMTV
ncbi:MAG: hypothetical protein Q7J24_17295, partial [Desulfomicrobium sp.]|nr:hypothetical protein [Desulfomicrobium sp.]